jgi:hypothetical protein
MEWLKLSLTERKCEAGEVLFYKDEKAEDRLHIVSGRFAGRIRHRAAGRRHRRRALACCRREPREPDAGMHRGRSHSSVSYTKVEELYVQNPEFGFYFLRLASARLFQNLATLEQRLAQQAGAAPVAPTPA